MADPALPPPPAQPLHGAIARITKRYQKRIQRATKVISGASSSLDDAEDIKMANYVQRNAEIAEFLKQYGITVEHHGELLPEPAADGGGEGDGGGGAVLGGGATEKLQSDTPSPGQSAPPTPPLSLEFSLAATSPARPYPPQPPPPPTVQSPTTVHKPPRPPALAPAAHPTTHPPDAVHLEHLQKLLGEAQTAVSGTRNTVTTVEFTRKHSPATSEAIDVQIAQMQNFIMTVERFAAVVQNQIDALGVSGCDGDARMD